MAYAGVFGFLIHLGFLNSAPLNGPAFGIANVVVPCLFFMPTVGNGVLGNENP